MGYPNSHVFDAGGEQVRGGDWIKVDFDAAASRLTFQREAEGLPIQAMAELASTSSILGLNAFTRVFVEPPPRASTARSSRRS